MTPLSVRGERNGSVLTPRSFSRGQEREVVGGASRNDFRPRVSGRLLRNEIGHDEAEEDDDRQHADDERHERAHIPS